MPEKISYEELMQKIRSLEGEVERCRTAAEEGIESARELHTLYEEALNPILLRFPYRRTRG